PATGSPRRRRRGVPLAGTTGHSVCRAREACTPASPAVAKHDEGGVVVAAPLELVESFGRGERGAGRLLHHAERGWREPAAGAGRGERRFGQAAAGRRIEKGERERLRPRAHA